MTAEQYLQQILIREAVDVGPYSPVRNVQNLLQPAITAWASGYLASVNPSGPFAKDTANNSGTDIDLFISLAQNTPNTLKKIYDTLTRKMKQIGLTPRRQNVSVNVLSVLRYLRGTFPGARVIDPANTNNIISDDLTSPERGRVRAAATHALMAGNWNQIVQ